MLETVTGFFVAIYLSVMGWFGAAIPVESLNEIETVEFANQEGNLESQGRIKLYDKNGNETKYEKSTSTLYYFDSPVDLSWLLESGLSLDLESLEIINESYSKDKYSVYIGLGQKFSNVVEGADPKTFRLDDPYIGRDAKSVWIMDAYETLVEGADPATFETIPNIFNKDINYGYFKDKNRVYRYVGEHLSARAIPIPGADPATFKIVYNNIEYDAEDKNNKYKNVEIVEVGNESTYNVLVGLDGKDWGFARDQNRLYYNNFPYSDEVNQKYAIISSNNLDEVEEGFKSYNLDTSSFSVVGDGYVKDKNKVFFLHSSGWVEVKGADAATFTIDTKTISQEYYGGAIAKDAFHVYRAWNLIEGADPDSYVKINDDWSKDSKYVFAEGNEGVPYKVVVNGIDPKTFNPILWDFEPTIYGSASGKVVCAHQGYIDADLTTFKVTGKFSAKDKTHTYNGCEVYDANNP